MKRLILPFVLALSAPAWGAEPSFDCARAEGEVQTLICADETLAALDREIARLYALAQADPALTDAQAAALRAYQRGWIKGRDECWKADAPRLCARREQMLRILELRAGSARAGADDQGISGGPLRALCPELGTDALFAWALTRPGLAALAWIDQALALEQTVAASGVRYEDEAAGVVFWTKGDRALLSIPGRERLNCVLETPE